LKQLLRFLITPAGPATQSGTKDVTITLQPSSDYVGGGSPRSITLRESFVRSTYPPEANPNSPPPVRVEALDQEAAERPGQVSTGALYIHRTSPYAPAGVTIQLSQGGTSIVGVDYQPAPATVALPFQKWGVGVVVTPIDDPELEGPIPEFAGFSITPDPAYTPDYSSPGSYVYIADDYGDRGNRAPVATADAYSVSRNGSPVQGNRLEVSAPGVLGNDADADADVLHVVSATRPAHAAEFSWCECGDFVYEPAVGFVGDDTFTYVVTDGIVSTTATVTIHVTNEAPVGEDDYYEVWEDALLQVSGDGVLLNDGDPNDDPLTAVLVDGPDFAAPGSFHLNSDGSFEYQIAETLPPEFDGIDSFTYRAYDGSLSSSIVTVTLHISLDIAAPGEFVVKLIDVTFGAVQGQGKLHVMTSDDGKTEFNGQYNKHWRDQNGNGVIERTQKEDHGWPVAYTRNSRMAVTATFQLEAASYNLVKQAKQNQQLRVRGTEWLGDDRVFDVAANQIALDDARRTLTVTQVAANKLLPNTIQFIKNLKLEWRVSLDGGSEWADAGASITPVYVLLSDPKHSDAQKDKRLCYTVVDLGCELGQGLDNAAALPDRLMDGTNGTANNGFKSRAIKTVRLDVATEMPSGPGPDEPGHQYQAFPLKYYGSWTTQSTTTADLLKTRDGQCGAWVRFFIDILSAQGAIGWAPGVTPYISLQPTVRREWFLVKSWTILANPTQQPATIPDLVMLTESIAGRGAGDAVAQQITYQYANTFVAGDHLANNMAVSSPGRAYQWAGQPDVTYANQSNQNGPNNSQNNNNPFAIFNNHAVVKFGDMYYDPSYGNTYANLALIDDQIIDGFGVERLNPTTGQWTFWIRKNPPGVRDLYERYSPYGA
jgi:hypothetical protein